MPRLLPLLGILALLPPAALARDVSYHGDLAPLNITPTFDKGHLAVYEGLHTISLYGPDGTRAYKATAQVPGERSWNVVNAAPDSDGSLVMAVEYLARGSFKGGGFAVFDRKGTQSGFIDTGAEWWPTQACIAPDHTIWAMGWRGPDRQQTSDDYYVLRNYSRDGQLLSAYLPRSSFEQDPVGPIVGGWQLRCANGRIGGMFYATSLLRPGEERRSPQWIELNPYGSVVRRVEMPKMSISAFTDTGALYARGYEGGYFVFDSAANAWRPTTLGQSRGLLGADGDSLVFLSRPNTVVWQPLP
jgi:hypothetical protein